MPSKLSESPEELVRQFIQDNIRPAEIEGYNPLETDPTESDYLVVTKDWSKYGDTYPIIVVQENTGPQVPSSGETNYNSLGRNGPNQYVVYNVTVSCQAVEGEDGSGQYLNGTDAATLVQELYQECHAQIQMNTTTSISEAAFTGMTPATQTRDTQETDAGNTLTWIQRQGTVNMGFLNEP